MTEPYTVMGEDFGLQIYRKLRSFRRSFPIYISILSLASYGFTAVMKTSILLANILALLQGAVNAQSSTLTASSRSAAASATAAATPIINVNSTVTGALNATAWTLIVSSTKILISEPSS
jgi:hypothetical protein